MKISIVIPVINESELLPRRLGDLQSIRDSGHEVIVVDGGSEDNSLEVAAPLADKVGQCNRGRARQMNLGAQLASGDVLLFLHIDTCLPPDFEALVEGALVNQDSLWGRFDVRLSGDGALFTIIATAMNIRSHLTGVATGDQAMFVRKQVFQQLGGFAAIALMEDVELSKRLRHLSWPVRLKQKAIASSRRWEQKGVLKTILAMWWLRLLYFFGMNPDKIAIMYYK